MKNKKGFISKPLSFNRKALIASASVTKGKNAIHSLSEVDISIPRALIDECYSRTGERLSFTAYIVTCLAQLVRQYPRFNSFIKGTKLVILDNVTVSVLIERDISGEKVPEPIGIAQAQNKSYLQIHNEIRAAQKRTADTLGSFSGLQWIRFIPTFLLKSFVRLADRNIRLAKTYGKIAVTAIGMYSDHPLWFIPHGTATVLVTVGSISQKTIMIDGQYVAREHLCLTVSFDHNIIDGAPAARFMNDLTKNIKQGQPIKELLSEQETTNLSK